MRGERAVAADIGGTSTKVALVSKDGTVDGLSTFPTQGPAGLFVSKLASDIDVLHRQAPDAIAVGVSVAGFVDHTASAMVYNPNIPWLEGFPLRTELGARIGQNLAVLEADSNAACFAEYSIGLGLGSTRFLCLSIGTGIGGAMIAGGRIVRLAWGGLGDIGHVIVDPSGPRCPSGCRGCAEAVISAPGIEARWAGPRPKTLRDIIEGARNGDSEAAALIAETGRLLGIVLASCSAILFPDTIAIAGGVAEAGDLLLKPARASLESTAGPFYRRGIRVWKAKWGWQAPLVGAGLLALGREAAVV